MIKPYNDSVSYYLRMWKKEYGNPTDDEMKLFNRLEIAKEKSQRLGMGSLIHRLVNDYCAIRHRIFGKMSLKNKDREIELYEKYVQCAKAGGTWENRKGPFAQHQDELKQQFDNNLKKEKDNEERDTVTAS
jgi:hypothetical protein